MTPEVVALSAHLAHELRTPLNAILGYAQLLAAGDLRREQQEYVRQILAAAHHLRCLVDDTLDLSLLQQGRLRLACEPVPVVQVMREAVAMVAPLASERPVRLAVGGAPAGWCVAGDRRRLGQVLLNLLTNAVKYNRPGGTVRVTAQRVVADRVRLAVADEGPGIPPEQQHRLFVPFERLGVSAVGGAGIGLAVAKWLVHAMGGTIGVDSCPGHGATFWIEFPLMPAAYDSRSAAGA
ncbi:MAG: HAMP domain-containing sensor histidine kinase [Armatimonadota bacterium]|nr:HAMP domain-containing sensor histidine kinase [Armatimonadota bacterium]